MKDELKNLSSKERQYLSDVYGNKENLSLEEVWALMDAAWKDCSCDPNVMDDRIAKFYEHPVWLLNGLFIEKHKESIKHRVVFANYIAGTSPRRVADVGGGFGTLARMIGRRCPDAKIHVIEPHPHSIAVSKAESTSNVRYKKRLSGEYDVLVATDVFEHIPDPLSLVEDTASHLKLNGVYLIANCFWPVISCHLPETFHFRWSWASTMKAMNLKPEERVSYGRAFKRIGSVNSFKGRRIERQSKRLFPLIERLPISMRRTITMLALFFL